MTSAHPVPPAPEDERWMRLALREARAARLIAPPNPAVGCVITRDGQELARGHTQAPGGAHAEISALEALRARGLSAAGATVYVTLEPCSHQGRTPPCADRLVAERPARVVVATVDPNPLVSGRGLARLREAGIEVTTGVLEEAAIESNIGFITRMRQGRPWVRLKLAAGLDGRTALENGASQWITSELARRDGRRLRALSQGVLSGVGTVNQDDPQFTVRLGRRWPDPPKFICDSFAHTRPDRQALRGAPCVVFVSALADQRKRRRLRLAGAEVVEIARSSPGRLDLGLVLEELGRREINVLHVEAGATLSGALLSEDLVDEIVLYTAPCLMGQGPGLAALPRYREMSEAPRWSIREVRRLGPDLRLTLRRRATDPVTVKEEE